MKHPFLDRTLVSHSPYQFLSQLLLLFLLNLLAPPKPLLWSFTNAHTHYLAALLRCLILSSSSTIYFTLYWKDHHTRSNFHRPIRPALCSCESIEPLQIPADNIHCRTFRIPADTQVSVLEPRNLSQMFFASTSTWPYLTCIHTTILNLYKQICLYQTFPHLTVHLRHLIDSRLARTSADSIYTFIRCQLFAFERPTPSHERYFWYYNYPPSASFRHF